MENKQDTINVLIDAELPMLRTVAYRVLGNTHDADEAIQNALLKAWKHFERFRNESKLSSWVYRVTLNECFEMLRKRKTELKYLKMYAENPQPNKTVDDERLNELRLAIAALPKIYRAALTVGYLSELSTENAAEKLECSVNTLYQRIHKAKQLLKRRMERA